MPQGDERQRLRVRPRDLPRRKKNRGNPRQGRKPNRGKPTKERL